MQILYINFVLDKFQNLIDKFKKAFGMLSKNKIKFIRSLQQKKFRDESKLFVVEGVKMLREALNEIPDQLHELYALPNLKLSEGDDGKLTKFEITEDQLRQISSLKSPNKCLGVFRQLEQEVVQDDFYLALDGIQDPGNMGTLIRLADWYGVKCIFCSQDTVDLYNPKVLQASMGSFMRVQVLYVDLEKTLPGLNLPLYGAFLGGENLYTSNLSRHGILLLGNEGNGISSGMETLVDSRLTIPSLGSAESLNVSIAGSILLSEFHRGVFQ